MIHSLINKLLTEILAEMLGSIFLGEKLPLDITRASSNVVIIPAYRKINKTYLRKLANQMVLNDWECDPSPIRNKLREYFAKWESEKEKRANNFIAEVSRCYHKAERDY